MVGLLTAAGAFGAHGRTASPKRKARTLYNCSKKIQEAVQRFSKRRYGDVQVTLADVKFQCSGHDAMDTVVFYLGKSLMMLKRTEEAITEFEELVRDFPNSPFAGEARFRIGHCSLIGSGRYDRDQAGTRDAIRELTEFAEANPDSPFADSARAYVKECREKLARKEFMNARFYEKIDEYESAVVYYKVFLEEYADSKLIPEVKLSMAENLLKINRITEARETIDELVNGDYDETVKNKARAIGTRIGKQN
jgi:outer membrane protein assembly factor BamD